ncbi:hypothetical protein C0995_008663, partial [Termitomyces sp. Mi166
VRMKDARSTPGLRVTMCRPDVLPLTFSTETLDPGAAITDERRAKSAATAVYKRIGEGFSREE